MLITWTWENVTLMGGGGQCQAKSLWGPKQNLFLFVVGWHKSCIVAPASNYCIYQILKFLMGPEYSSLPGLGHTTQGQPVDTAWLLPTQTI